MADPIRREDVAQWGQTRSGFERLLATMVESGRTGAQATLQMTPYGAEWARLERAVGTIIERRLGSTPAAPLDAETLALIRRTDVTLRQDPAEAFRGPAYAQGITLIDDARAAGLELMHREVVAAQVYPAVVWYSVWHLIGASLPVAAILGVIDPPANTVHRAATPPPAHPRPRSIHPTPPPPRPAVAATPATPRASAPPVREPAKAHSVLDRLVNPPEMRKARDERLARLGNGIAGLAAGAIGAVREAGNRAKQARKDKAMAVAAAREAALLRAQPVPVEAPQSRSDAPSAPSPLADKLDGPRMRSPVAGTWLMLVVLSWVALIWGAILAIPFVGPFGIIGATMGGFIAVPLWGTFWGFVGMDHARDGTLRAMGFKPAVDGDWLSTMSARLAAQLDLQPPHVGTIPAFNAFAMGSDHRHATVAMGTPLLEALTLDEAAAVVGHELGHVVSGDMRRMMLMRTFQNACVWYMLAQGLKQFARWVISWAAELAILAFSRRREYFADAVGAALTSKSAMIGALRKLEAGPALTSEENRHARFMVRGRLSTHPTVAQRIAALEAETYIRRLPLRG